ncbi:hypothetical protein [Streptomyces sp. TM32]|nr:hypothetical protein [Streptomyces sp. TM32]
MFQSARGQTLLRDLSSSGFIAIFVTISAPPPPSTRPQPRAIATAVRDK